MWKSEIKIETETVTLTLILKFLSVWEWHPEKSPTMQKPVNGFILQIEVLDSI